jgi:hypothetical protein
MTDKAILSIAVLMFVVTPALIMGAGAIVLLIDHIKQALR